MRQLRQATGALAEILARDDAAGVDVHAPSRVVEGSPPAPPPPLLIPRPNWREEERERVNRAPVKAITPELVAEDEQYLPAKRQQPTPRIDAVKRWMGTQMKGAGT